MKIEGLIVGDGHKRAAFYLPGEGRIGEPRMVIEVELTLEEAQAWLEQSDNPSTPIGKALVRKASRQVDQSVAWAVYERASYTCEYCGDRGVPLTYDHWVPQKLGGKTTLENGVAACRPCNKAKGHMTPRRWREWMDSHGSIRFYSDRIRGLQT